MSTESLRVRVRPGQPLEFFWRDGFFYDLCGGGTYYRISAEETFEVDGILYDRQALDEESIYVRPMIQYLADVNTTEHAWMWCSSPPSEAELDEYVHLDRLPPLPLPKGSSHHGNQTSR